MPRTRNHVVFSTPDSALGTEMFEALKARREHTDDDFAEDFWLETRGDNAVILARGDKRVVEDLSQWVAGYCACMIDFGLLEEDEGAEEEEEEEEEGA